MQSFLFPCTGSTDTRGFPEYLSRELGAPRANLVAFAKELGDYFGPRHVTLVNSGSSANMAAATALAEVTGGGEALIAGFTFPTTLSSLLAAGFSVRAIDTEKKGFGMDPLALEAAIGPETRLVCVTHFLGFPANLKELQAIATRNHALVLQDACETMDLRIKGNPAHTMGDLTTWSFYHPHHLSAFGGGAVLSPDSLWHQRVDSVVHWGRACTCHIESVDCPAPPGMHHNFHYVRRGYNFEMSELNACFGRFALDSWAVQERQRLMNYGVLFDALSDVSGIDVYALPPASGSPFVFPISLQRRRVSDFAAAMAEKGVEVRSLMGGPIVDQPAYLDIPHDGLRECRALGQRSCFVGVHQTLSTPVIEQLAQLLREELVA